MIVILPESTNIYNTQELDSEPDIIVYPSPASDILFVQSQTIFMEYVNVTITDISGKILFHSIEKPRYDNTVSLDISVLRRGIYIIYIQQQSISPTHLKFIKN